MEVRETSAAYGGLVEIAIDVVPAGYKRTEVGVIPEDWELNPLGSLITSTDYGSSAKSHARGDVPVLRMGNLQDGKINWNDLVYTSDEIEIEKYKLVPGDVLFNRTNTVDLVGKTSLFNGTRPAVFAGYLIRIKGRSSILEPRFLNFVLNAEFSRKFSARVLSVAVSQANINAQKLRTYPIPTPDFVEQEAIAEALSDAETLIESLEQLLAKKRQIKQGTMQELLTGKKRLPGFIGEVDSQRLDELGRWVGGMTPSMSNHLYWQPGIIPWISSGDVKSPRLMVTSQYVTALALKDHATTLVPEKSVVVVMRSGILRKFLPVTMNMIPMTINQDLKALIPGNGICPEYVLHALIGSGSEILARCLKSGTTVESIEFGWLKSFTIRVPPFAEQAMIAAVLTDMDTELDELETRIAKNHALKQGMMQELLTGRIRLT